MRLENIKDTSSTSQKEKDIAREGEGRGLSFDSKPFAPWLPSPLRAMSWLFLLYLVEEHVSFGLSSLVLCLLLNLPTKGYQGSRCRRRP